MNSQYPCFGILKKDYMYYNNKITMPNTPDTQRSDSTSTSTGGNMEEKEEGLVVKVDSAAATTTASTRISKLPPNLSG